MERSKEADKLVEQLATLRKELSNSEALLKDANTRASQYKLKFNQADAKLKKEKAEWAAREKELENLQEQVNDAASNHFCELLYVLTQMIPGVDISLIKGNFEMKHIDEWAIDHPARVAQLRPLINSSPALVGTPDSLGDEEMTEAVAGDKQAEVKDTDGVEGEVDGKVTNEGTSEAADKQTTNEGVPEDDPEAAIPIRTIYPGADSGAPTV